MVGKTKDASKKVKTTKSKSKKVEETPVESTPVVETPVVETPVVETPTVETTEVSSAVTEQTPDEFEVLMQSVLDRHEVIEKEQKLLKLESKRLIKIVAKKYKKKKKKSGGGNKAPSGFAKPAPISAELCAFLDVAEGSELARTSVTKALNLYIKSHNLQDETNKRTINPDAALKQLLKLKPDESITYFNLQKYMKAHFPKKEVSVAV
jgi:chromatin remodeling complex protein RSC6